tara:strand:+ start:2882 stop:3853 length:972 start_codon:yes stop_codon:yes gene_type:complete
MSNLEKNTNLFLKQYNLEKRNYNIIIHGKNGLGKFDFIINILNNYFKKNNITTMDPLTHPDTYYLSLPLYDKAGKIIRSINNDERLLYEYGFEDTFDSYRVGSEIAINQIRRLIEFTQLSPTEKHKIIIINNCNYLNQESSAALLKTLEETESPSIFFLLSSETSQIKDTIISRCHLFSYNENIIDNKYNSLYNFFILKNPKLKNIIEEYDHVSSFKDAEDEIALIFNNKKNSLAYSEEWSHRGSLYIDYLIDLFSLLMKGPYLKSNNQLTEIYNKLHNKISISSSKATKIITFLTKKRREIKSNINKKLFYDDLLIVLQKEL